jgi:hypothetical protein
MGRDHLGNLDVHGRIILKWILKEIVGQYESMGRICLGQRRDWKWALVSAVMNPGVPQKVGGSC